MAGQIGCMGYWTTTLTKPALSTPQAESQRAAEPSSTADRLRELDALLKQELISKKEYNQQRKEIIDAL